MIVLCIKMLNIHRRDDFVCFLSSFFLFSLCFSLFSYICIQLGFLYLNGQGTRGGLS